MPSLAGFLILILLFVLLVYRIVTHSMTRNHKTSNVIGALLNYFTVRREKIIEFRILKEKAQVKVREFEVKTIHQKYFTVLIKGMTVLSVTSIERFSITEEESFMRGKVDPVDLDRFELMVNDMEE